MVYFFFFNDTATTEIYTLSLHDALPISSGVDAIVRWTRQARLNGWITYSYLDGEVELEGGERVPSAVDVTHTLRSEEHTSELQSRQYLVCRLLLEKKKKKTRACPESFAK